MSLKYSWKASPSHLPRLPDLKSKRSINPVLIIFFSLRNINFFITFLKMLTNIRVQRLLIRFQQNYVDKYPPSKHLQSSKIFYCVWLLTLLSNLSFDVKPEAGISIYATLSPISISCLLKIRFYHIFSSLSITPIWLYSPPNCIEKKDKGLIYWWIDCNKKFKLIFSRYLMKHIFSPKKYKLVMIII